jgi:hypothetical protein
LRRWEGKSLGGGFLFRASPAPIVPEFLRVKSVAGKIEDIIAEARERLIIVSPYVKVSDTFMTRLKTVDRQQIPITFVQRQGDNKPAEDAKLLSLSTLSLYALKDLHAKCYLNEKRLIITSLNLYETSEKNWEMGVVFTADEPVYQEAYREVQEIIAASTQIHRPKTAAATVSAVKPARAPKTGGSVVRAPVAKDRPRKQKGACIRCSGEIAYNNAAPLCRTCWTTWADFKNPDYPEHYCHECGRKAKTSMGHPRCKSCYSATPQA